MIPAIGVMIGCYIITRMVELALPESADWAEVILWVLAVITIVVTGMMMVDLVTGSQSVNESLGGSNNPAPYPFGQEFDTTVILPPYDP